MDMQKVINLFGSKAKIARAIGVTNQALNNWSDPLSPTASDRVLAACVREGIDPAPLLDTPDSEALKP